MREGTGGHLQPHAALEHFCHGERQLIKMSGWFVDSRGAVAATTALTFDGHREASLNIAQSSLQRTLLPSHVNVTPCFSCTVE